MTSDEDPDKDESAGQEEPADEDGPGEQESSAADASDTEDSLDDGSAASTSDESTPPVVTAKRWFVRRHPVYTLSVLVASLVACMLGFIFTRMWGSQQWGPVSEWVAGTLTLTAVVVALRESMRAQAEREIDLELERRRECIRAVADYWAAVMKVRGHTFDLLFFLISRDFSQSEQQAQVIGERRAYHTTIQDSYMPQEFYSSLVLHETPLLAPLEKVDAKIEEARHLLLKYLEEARNGTKPSVNAVYPIWSDIVDIRPRHFAAARSTFSLDRRTVRAQLRGRRT